MSGFKDNSLNIAFEAGLFESIIEHLIKCSSQMKDDCIKSGNYLKNHEDRITDRLVAEYLNRGPNIIRFESQVPETFNAEKDRYDGRTDIKVITPHWFIDKNIYYTIECKRLDGGNDLNKKYITEGIARFVLSPPKYQSYYKRNIMFGYIVGSVNISENTATIGALQGNLLDGIVSSAFTLICSADLEHYIYSCQYQSETDCIELRHLFYNFADAICS